MKPDRVPRQPYSILTDKIESDNNKYLELSAPLIGYIVYDFNILEETLTDMICEMISEMWNDEGLVITQNMNFASKVALFDRYSKWVQSGHEKKLPIHKSLVNNLIRCGQLRNIVVHSEYEPFDLEGYTLTKFKIDPNASNQEYVQFDIESLKRIRVFIKSTIEQILHYDTEIKNL